MEQPSGAVASARVRHANGQMAREPEALPTVHHKLLREWKMREKKALTGYAASDAVGDSPHAVEYLIG